MNKETIELKLPTGKGLPPPPPMEREAFTTYWLTRLAEFYQSPHYEAWMERTSREMKDAAPFVWFD